MQSLFVGIFVFCISLVCGVVYISRVFLAINDRLITQKKREYFDTPASLTQCNAYIFIVRLSLSRLQE